MLSCLVLSPPGTSSTRSFLLEVFTDTPVKGYMEAPKRCVHDLTLGTCEYDLIQEKGFYRHK